MARRKGLNVAQAWLLSGSWPATIVTVVLGAVLALLSPVLVPAVWAVYLAVKAYNALLDWHAARRDAKAAS